MNHAFPFAREKQISFHPSHTPSLPPSNHHDRHLSDESINQWINEHICTLLLCGLLVMAACASAWQWLFWRSMARVNPSKSSPFCSRRPALCMRNRFYASLLWDYRHTRDAQLDPTGRRTTIKGWSNKLEECELTTGLHYDDARIAEWWGHLLPGQEEGLYACPTPCRITGDRGEADVLVRMFEPTPRSEMSASQKAAVINTEAHSLSKGRLEATDLLVSYSRLADVVVGCDFPCVSLHAGPSLCLPDSCLTVKMMAPPFPGTRTV